MRYIIKFLSGIDKYLKVNTSSYYPFDSDLTTDLFEARTFVTERGAKQAANRIVSNWLKGSSGDNSNLIIDYEIFEIEVVIVRKMTT